MNQFGIDESELHEVMSGISLCNYIERYTVCMFLYTRKILNARVLGDFFESVYKLIARMVIEYGVNIRVIDMGGDYCIPYYQNQEKLNIDIIRRDFD